MNLTQLGWRHFFQQQLSLDEHETLSPARVMTVERSTLGLSVDGGSLVAELELAWQQRPHEDRPTVGDWVLIDADHRLQRLLDRQSVFKRKAAGERADVQLIGANVDTLFVVTSCNADFNLSRLERYLALALDARVTPVIVLTKADLEPSANYIDQARTLRNDLDVVAVNALNPEHIEPLRAWCTQGQTVALVGSSGVGKSTLLNTLMGTAVQATGAIRTDDAKGRHTTTSRSLHLLPDGGLVLDSPGMRELKLTDVAAGLAGLFEDIEALAEDCRFQRLCARKRAWLCGDSRDRQRAVRCAPPGELPQATTRRRTQLAVNRRTPRTFPSVQQAGEGQFNRKEERAQEGSTVATTGFLPSSVTSIITTTAATMEYSAG